MNEQNDKGSNSQPETELRQRKPPNRNPLLIAGAGVALTLVIGTTSASAFGIGSLGGIMGTAEKVSPFLKKAGVDIGDYLKQANEYFGYANLAQEVFGNLSKGRFGKLLGNATEVMGVLGMPDPGESTDKIESATAQTEAKLTGVNPGVQGELAKGEFFGEYAKMQAQSALGKAGQEQAKKMNTAADQALGEAAAAGSEAQKSNVTQEVMKYVAQQQQQQAFLQRANLAETQAVKFGVHAGNLTLSSMNEQMNADQRQEAYSRSQEAQQVLKSAGFGMGMWEPITDKK